MRPNTFRNFHETIMQTVSPDLSVCIPLFSDHARLGVTLQHLLRQHAEVFPRLQVVLIDETRTTPEQAQRYTAGFRESFPNVNYLGLGQAVGANAVYAIGFAAAKAPQVLWLAPGTRPIAGSLEKLIAFYRRYPNFHDLVHGVMTTADDEPLATGMTPGWLQQQFGVLELDPDLADPQAEMREIAMHSMQVFACTRIGWPGLAGGTRGWGAVAGGIHEKFRRLGRKVWCFPFLRWSGPESHPLTAIASYSDRIHNYAVSFREAGLPTENLLQPFLTKRPEELRLRMGTANMLQYPDRYLPRPLSPATQSKPFLGHPLEHYPSLD